MAPVTTPSTFPLLTTIPSPSILSTIPPFTVSLTRGFLPLSNPPADLPVSFAPLTSLLTRMPIQTLSGRPGLLATFTLGEAVLSELLDLTDEVDAVKGDLRVICALYRDYSFLASAYLLEPCHERWLRGEEYGLGRQRLPACIARPLAKVAEISGFKPFMEYAGSYALFNYSLADSSLGMEYSNLRLIRAFEKGLDPSSSEAGFVLVHVDMVQNSGLLVQGAVNSLSACGVNDREGFNRGLELVVEAMEKVNRVMDGMWKKSHPGDYNSFRTFIFGITSQSMFPHGVVYEGVSAEPMSFRGESGANDSMIPLVDNLLQIPMPPTPLTAILADFRSYRPGNHREFLEWVQNRADDLGIAEYAIKERTSAVIYLRVLDQIRNFRWRHWCFTREYVLKKSPHPTATGGSPIVLWLPNQLQSVYSQMIHVSDTYSTQGGLTECEEMMSSVRAQKEMLSKEVSKYCEERKA